MLLLLAGQTDDLLEKIKALQELVRQRESSLTEARRARDYDYANTKMPDANKRAERMRDEWKQAETKLQEVLREKERKERLIAAEIKAKEETEKLKEKEAAKYQRMVDQEDEDMRNTAIRSRREEEQRQQQEGSDEEARGSSAPTPQQQRQQQRPERKEAAGRRNVKRKASSSNSRKEKKSRSSRKRSKESSSRKEKERRPKEKEAKDQEQESFCDLVHLWCTSFGWWRNDFTFPVVFSEFCMFHVHGVLLIVALHCMLILCIRRCLKNQGKHSW